MKPRALISIHDVTPSTLDDVEQTIALARPYGIDRLALLVVPGADWADDDLARLRALLDAGHELAAQGWFPVGTSRRTVHRLHARLVAGNVAEHLALDRQHIIELMRRSQQWFADQALPIPDAYVPPAWALGRLRNRDLKEQPFTVLETLRSVRVRDAHGEYVRTPHPLLAFEADTSLRAELLANWNRLQLRRARRLGQALRIALHPRDHQLQLSDQLRAVLALGWTSITYHSLLEQEQMEQSLQTG